MLCIFVILFSVKPESVQSLVIEVRSSPLKSKLISYMHALYITLHSVYGISRIWVTLHYVCIATYFVTLHDVSVVKYTLTQYLVYHFILFSNLSQR